MTFSKSSCSCRTYIWKSPSSTMNSSWPISPCLAMISPGFHRPLAHGLAEGVEVGLFQLAKGGDEADEMTHVLRRCFCHVSCPSKSPARY